MNKLLLDLDSLNILDHLDIGDTSFDTDTEILF